MGLYEKRPETLIHVHGLNELTELAPPLDPKRLIPLMAWSAATAIPMEEEFSSGSP